MTDTLARVKRATKKRATAEREWRDAIRAAATTNSLRTVGEAANITHARVLQITRE